MRKIIQICAFRVDDKDYLFGLSNNGNVYVLPLERPQKGEKMKWIEVIKSVDNNISPYFNRGMNK